MLYLSPKGAITGTPVCLIFMNDLFWLVNETDIFAKDSATSLLVKIKTYGDVYQIRYIL